MMNHDVEKKRVLPSVTYHFYPKQNNFLKPFFHCLLLAENTLSGLK
jgi:hypothetical protein